MSVDNLAPKCRYKVHEISSRADAKVSSANVTSWDWQWHCSRPSIHMLLTGDIIVCPQSKEMLAKVAMQVQPVMRKHSWDVPLLSELTAVNGRLWVGHNPFLFWGMMSTSVLPFHAYVARTLHVYKRASTLGAGAVPARRSS